MSTLENVEMLLALNTNDNNEESKSESSIFKFAEKKYSEIGIRIRIDELLSVDTATQRYRVKFVLDRSWLATEKDKQLFAELKRKNKLSEYTPERTPCVDYVNDVGGDDREVSFDETQSPYIVVKGLDGNLYNRYLIESNHEFTEEFEVGSYPFDVQDLSIVMAPSTASVKEVRFVPHHILTNLMSINKTWSSITNFDIVALSPKEYVVDWVASLSGGRKTGQNETDFYSYVNFKIQVKRKWKGVLSRVVSWMILLGILSLGIFAHPSNAPGDRLAFGITMVLTIVAFQFIISSSLPQVNYLTLLDWYNFFIFGLTVAEIIESSIIGWKENGYLGDNDKVDKLDDLCAAIFACLFVVGHILFFSTCCYLNAKENEKIGKNNEKLKLDLLTIYNDKNHNFSDTYAK